MLVSPLATHSSFHPWLLLVPIPTRRRIAEQLLVHAHRCHVLLAERHDLQPLQQDGLVVVLQLVDQLLDLMLQRTHGLVAEHGPPGDLAPTQSSLVPLSLLLGGVLLPPKRLALPFLPIFSQSQVSDLLADAVE